MPGNTNRVMLITTALIVLWGGSAVAQTELNGSIENQSSIRLNDPFDFMKLNDFFNLKINSALEENVSAYADLDLKHAFGNKDMSGYILQYDEKTARDNYLAVNLKELYIDLSMGIFDFRLGKQIVSWGKVDAFAPTGNINPSDYRAFDILESSDMNIAIPMLKVDAYLLYDYLHIEAIYIPYFFETIFPDSDSDWAFYQPPFPEKMVIEGSTYNVDSVEQKPAVYPAKTLKNAEAGLRVGSSIGGYDFSGSYFFTWDDNPTVHQELSLDSPGPGAVTVTTTPKYHRLHIIGLDLAKAIGELNLRTESAFFITEDPTGEDSYIADPYLKWAAGADYTFLNNYTINLQFSEEIKNLAFGASDVETSNSIIASLSANLLEERLSVELGGIYEFEDEDYLFVPQVEYDFSDSLSFSFGAQIFGGDKGTQFGSYDENDALFIKAKYSF